MGTDKVLTRVGGVRDMLLGGMQAFGGGLQMIGAAKLCATGIGCVLGAPLMVNGANDVLAGGSMMLDGEFRLLDGDRRRNLAIDPLNSVLDMTVGDGYMKMGIATALNFDPAGVGKGGIKMGLANMPKPKGSNNPIVRSSIEKGKEMHKKIQSTLGDQGFQSEVSIPGYGRADAVNFDTKTIIEIKPNNSRAINRGNKQLNGYIEGLTNLEGGPWNGVIKTYD